MTQFTFALPDDVVRKLESRAREAGSPSVRDYAEELLRDDAEGAEDVDYGAPESVKIRTAEQLNQLLAERYDKEEGSIEATPEFFDQLRDRLRRRISAREAKP